MRIATWNLQWAGPRSKRLRPILDRLDSVQPDVAVLTEVDLQTLESWPNVSDSGVHPQHADRPKRRKVAIVSRLPMTLVDEIGSPDLPPKNFVAVDVETPSGTVRVIGIVIRYNQKEAFVGALPKALEATVVERTIVAGDFNLTMPGAGLSRRLQSVLESFGLEVATAGDHAELDGEGRLMDHIALSRDLSTSGLRVWPRVSAKFEQGSKEVSDHAGCCVTVSPQ